MEVPRESGRIFAIIDPDGWELQLLERMKIHPLFRGIARDMRKEESGGAITTQLRRLGVSCDWSRERFTMDADYSQWVSRVFADLFHEGLIYRGKRMVNWCPVSLTALSDEEVIPKKQNSKLYFIK